VDFTDAKDGSRILDVATGTGGQAFAFARARRGYDVVGIDLSEEMLKVANQKNGNQNLRYQVADATNLPFEDDHFDVSCVSFALHEMPLAMREKAIEEMVRVTRPKGMIVVVDYALPENRIGRYLIFHPIKSLETKYYPEFVESDLKALLRKSGVEIGAERRAALGGVRILKGIKR